MPIHQLRLNIDLELLKRQINNLALAKGNCWPAGGGDEPRIEESIEGALNLLGKIRDQIDPPQDITTTKTDPRFWDCECKENYIIPKSITYCWRCCTSHDEQPDSRVNELAREGLLTP